jgi:hypothetical protein
MKLNFWSAMHLPIMGQVAFVNSMSASMMWYFINI